MEEKTTPNTGKGLPNLRKRLLTGCQVNEDSVGKAAARLSGERKVDTILDVAAFQSSI